MDPAHARRFMDRPWDAVSALEQEHWAREFARRGPAATLEATQMLWLHMRRVRPDWPSDTERGQDLAHHIELKRAIDRAARAFLALDAR